MKRIVSMHAYDCLSTIVATATVREYSTYETDDHGEVVFTASVVIPSVGREDPELWLRDVVLALLS